MLIIGCVAPEVDRQATGRIRSHGGGAFRIDVRNIPPHASIVMCCAPTGSPWLGGRGGIGRRERLIPYFAAFLAARHAALLRGDAEIDRKLF
jgi:hypothetical protein